MEPVRAFEIYEHLRQSGSTRESLPFGLTAARYFSSALAIDLAVTIQLHLLSLVASEEDLPVRLEMLGELSRLDLRRGRVPAAKGHIKRLLEEGADLDMGRKLEALVQLSEVYRAGGEQLKGIKVLNRAQKQCSEVIDDLGQARISGLLARQRLDRQDPKRSINLCVRGLAGLEGVKSFGI